MHGLQKSGVLVYQKYSCGKNQGFPREQETASLYCKLEEEHQSFDTEEKNEIIDLEYLFQALAENDVVSKVVIHRLQISPKLTKNLY